MTKTFCRLPCILSLLTISAACVDTVASLRKRSGDQVLRAHFYDVGQAAAALIEMPGGTTILVDAGDSATRAGCESICEKKHRHLMEALRRDLAGRPITLLFVSHQHSDHLGGAVDVVSEFTVQNFADNGRDLDSPLVARLRDALEQRRVPSFTVEPGNSLLLEGIWSSGLARVTFLTPPARPTSCAHDRNQCSIFLRIDYGTSSLLFSGDAGFEEEALIDTHGHATLLQVGHHGGDTSSGREFLARVSPHYAVISAGRVGQGLNRTYCHPRASTVRALTDQLGSQDLDRLQAFDGSVPCAQSTLSHRQVVPASARLWATERDGDVVLETVGNGEFHRL